MNYRSSSVAIITRFGLLAKRIALLLGCVVLVLNLPVHAASWTPGILATSSASPAQIEAIPLQVTATQVSPPSITITTYAAGKYTISRKDPSANTWTQVASGVTLSASGTWEDSNVVVGTMYEYQFVNTASTPIENDPPYNIYATVGAPLDNHLLIRSAIQAIYNTYPGQLKNVAMVGKVPVCRTGIYDGVGIDGHGNECPYGADAFYAEMLGKIGVDWTDTQDNSSDVNLTNYNLPGDNQFDQQDISEININGTGQVQLGYGRIDLAQGIQTDIPADIEYFTKLHLYKIADPSFLPGRNVCDRQGGFPNVRETELQSMSGVVGINNIDFIPQTQLPAVQTGQDPDQLYSTENGPFLFYFKGDGAPQAGVNGKAVFWTGFQSHWGIGTKIPWRRTDPIPCYCVWPRTASRSTTLRMAGACVTSTIAWAWAWMRAT